MAEKAQVGDLIRITDVPKGWAYEVGGIYEVTTFNIAGNPSFEIPGEDGSFYAEEGQYVIHRKAGEESDGIDEMDEAYAESFDDVMPEDNAVNHPSHYTQGRFETIEIIEEITQGYSDGYVSYCVGNALKYLARAPFKHESPAEDIAKAEAYLRFASERLAKGER